MDLALLDERTLHTIWLAARKQIGDDDAAWDCVQEALATALRRPRAIPDSELVPWLCGVARNHARHWVRANARRSQAVRRMAARAAPRRGSVDRVALHDALAAIPAKQRDAVVLHYLTGRTFAEVADAQRISEAAAKARVRRGLAALRARLGAAPLALLLAREATAGALESIAAAASGVAMKKSLAIALVLCALVGVAVPLLSFAWDGGSDPARRSADTSPRTVSAAQPDRAATEPEPDAAGNTGNVYPAARSSHALEAIVVDAAGTRIPNAEVLVRSTRGGVNPALLVADDRAIRRRVRTGDGGSLELTLPAGPYVLEASAKAGASRATEAIVPAHGPVYLRLKPRAATGVSVIAVHPDDRPVPDARVAMAATPAGRARAQTVLGVTDREGRWRYAETELAAAHITVTAPDGSVGQTSATSVHELADHRRRGGIRVVVDGPGSLEGSLVGADDSGPVTVVARPTRSANAYRPVLGPARETVAANGRYRFDGLAAGTWSLAIRSASGLRLQLDPYVEGDDPVPNAVRLATAQVQAGATTRRDLELAAGGRVTGRVTSAGGPVAGARVQITFAPHGGNVTEGFRLHGVHVWRLDAEPHHWNRHEQIRRVVATGADGRYDVRGLQPGIHRVEVSAPRLSYDRRMDVAVSDGETVELEHELEPAGVLQLVGDTSYVGVAPAGSDRPLFIAIVDRVGCTVGGLAAGEYDVSAFHSDPARGRAHLARVRIEAGRTTWVDLRGEGPVRIRGRVRTPAGPLAGVAVSAGARPGKRTGPDGGFEFRSAFAWTGFVTFRVSVEGIRWHVPFPAMADGDTAWDGEILLGTETLTIRTPAADGGPARAEVGLRSEVRGNPVDGVARVIDARVASNAHGEARLRRLLPGRYTGHVEFASGLRIPFAVTLPADGAITIREPETAALRVTVLDPGDRPVAGARVTVRTWIGPGAAPSDDDAILARGAGAERTTGEDGTVRFEAAAAGEAVVVAGMLGPRLGGPGPVRERVRIGAAGPNAVTLRLPRE